MSLQALLRSWASGLLEREPASHCHRDRSPCPFLPRRGQPAELWRVGFYSTEFLSEEGNANSSRKGSSQPCSAAASPWEKWCWHPVLPLTLSGTPPPARWRAGHSVTVPTLGVTDAGPSLGPSGLSWCHSWAVVGESGAVAGTVWGCDGGQSGAAIGQSRSEMGESRAIMGQFYM